MWTDGIIKLNELSKIAHKLTEGVVLMGGENLYHQIAYPVGAALSSWSNAFPFLTMTSEISFSFLRKSLSTVREHSGQRPPVLSPVQLLTYAKNAVLINTHRCRVYGSRWSASMVHHPTGPDRLMFRVCTRLKPTLCSHSLLTRINSAAIFPPLQASSLRRTNLHHYAQTQA